MTAETKQDAAETPNPFGLVTPLTPNYIRTIRGDAIPVAELSDKALAAIGKKWIAALLYKAQRRRRDRG